MFYLQGLVCSYHFKKQSWKIHSGDRFSNESKLQAVMLNHTKIYLHSVRIHIYLSYLKIRSQISKLSLQFKKNSTKYEMLYFSMQLIMSSWEVRIFIILIMIHNLKSKFNKLYFLSNTYK